MPLFHIRLLLLPVLLVSLIIAGCGNEQSSPTGSATFNLQWQKPDTYVGKSVGAAADVCSDYGVQTITASFVDGNGISQASGSFACSDHQGLISGIPVANNYKVVMEGLSGSTGSSVAWRGEKTGVAISANVNTPVSSIVMNFIGSIATVKLSTQGTVAAGSIKGVEVTVTLPAGVTLKADANGIPNAGVVVVSGVAPGGSSLVAKYTPISGSTPGSVTISIANSTGFGAGEFVTITGDITSGLTPATSQFTLSGLAIFDGYGAGISGVSSSSNLTLQ